MAEIKDVELVITCDCGKKHDLSESVMKIIKADRDLRKIEH